MISPNMVVDGLTWREVTGPGTTYYGKKGNYMHCNMSVEQLLHIIYSVH